MEVLDEECLALEAIYGETFSRISRDRVRVVVEPLEPGTTTVIGCSKLIQDLGHEGETALWLCRQAGGFVPGIHHPR